MKPFSVHGHFPTAAAATAAVRASNAPDPLKQIVLAMITDLVNPYSVVVDCVGMVAEGTQSSLRVLVHSSAPLA